MVFGGISIYYTLQYRSQDADLLESITFIDSPHTGWATSYFSESSIYLIPAIRICKHKIHILLHMRCESESRAGRRWSYISPYLVIYLVTYIKKFQPNVKKITVWLDCHTPRPSYPCELYYIGDSPANQPVHSLVWNQNVMNTTHVLDLFWCFPEDM